MLGAVMLAGFAMLAPVHAQAAINDGADGLECPTVAVANNTSGTARSGGCLPTSVSAQPGDTVSVHVYYHNTAATAAHGVMVRVNQPSGSTSSLSFTGTVSSSDAGSSSGAATITLPSAQTLNFISAEYYPNKSSSAQSFPSGDGSSIVGSGVNLGTIPGYSDCGMLSTSVQDGYCHQGWVVAYFKVSSSTASLCNVSISASPTSIVSGGSSNLMWTAGSGCTNVTVTGPNGSISSAMSGNQMVYPTGTSTYTITGNGSTGSAQSQSVTINVNSVTSNCTATISSSQTQVIQGQPVTINWYTSGCTTATVTGPNGTISTLLSGSQQVYLNYGSAATYTVYATGGNSITQSVTVSSYGQTGTAPSVTTNAATNATTTSAMLNGYISSSNCSYNTYNCANSTYSSYYFLYGTSQYNLYSQTPTQTNYATSGQVSAFVSNLQPNTTYYFQLVGTNSYGTSNGGTLSFVTTGSTSGATAITLLATNIASTSARFNGLVVTPSSSTNGTTYFEYGTTQALGTVTPSQSIVNGSSNYFSVINTSPDTTYYYRITALINGQTYYGSIISFTTGGGTGGNPVVITRVIGTGGGSAYISLAITDQFANIAPGDTITYTVTYQNISGVTLSNAILNVILPTGVVFRQASQGLLTTNNTVAATLGTMLPNAQGTITITAVAPTTVTNNNLVTTATIAFTTPSKAQDSAIAYVLNTVGSQNNLAGLALFGAGFFPTSLLGWILLLGILLILILIARYYYHRTYAQRLVAVAPAANNHYYAAPAPVQPNMNQPHADQGYQGDHLPH